MFRRLLFILLLVAAALTISIPRTGAQQKPPEFKPAPEVPAMPKALMELPRTDITHAKFPTIDFHFHGRTLRTAQDYQKLIKLMDQTNLAVISNMDGGFGDTFDQASEAFAWIGIGLSRRHLKCRAIHGLPKLRNGRSRCKARDLQEF